MENSLHPRSVLCDQEIIDANHFFSIINPFIRFNEKGIFSYGLQPSGYDFRLDNLYSINIHPDVIDGKTIYPEIKIIDKRKNNMTHSFIEYGDDYILRPQETIIGESLEYFTMPDMLIGDCRPKSTYLRAGIITQMTVIDPGFKGKLKFSIHNSNKDLCFRLYRNNGIGQIVFHWINEPCANYDKKGGNYQEKR